MGNVAYNTGKIIILFIIISRSTRSLGIIDAILSGNLSYIIQINRIINSKN